MHKQSKGLKTTTDTLEYIEVKINMLVKWCSKIVEV